MHLCDISLPLCTAPAYYENFRLRVFLKEGGGETQSIYTTVYRRSGEHLCKEGSGVYISCS